MEVHKLSRFKAAILLPWHLIDPWGRALNLFIMRGGSTLAASVSFYTLLSVIPFLLLLVRMVGMWVKDIGLFKYHLFNFGKTLFPKMAPDLLNFAEKLVSTHLFASDKWTIINISILTFSALSMFSAIMYGVHWITQHEEKSTFVRYLKGVAIIFLTIALMLLALTLPLIIRSLTKLLLSSAVVGYMTHSFPSLNEYHEWIKNLKIGRYSFFKSRLLSMTIILFYFTFVYRWFFPIKVHIKYAFTAACTFVLLILSGRELIWVYLKFSKSGLMANYGNHYTLIVGIMWIFFLAAIFFYGICLMQAFWEKKQKSIVAMTNPYIPEPILEIPPIPTKDNTDDTNVD